MARRIASLWLPRLPTDRMLRSVRRGTEWREEPFAVVAEDHRGTRIAAVTACAEAQGVYPEMRLTDARALCPGIRTAMAAPYRDRAFLAGLRRWSERYSPWVAEDGDDGLIFDLTGCTHLFGGEDVTLADMVARLADLGVTARGALADTRGAAWALARYGAEVVTVVAAGETRVALSDLSPLALRLPAPTVESLARLGLRRIGDLVALPRASLARRFGIEMVRRLDQALGAEPEPVSPSAPLPTYALRRSLLEPIATVEAVLAVVEDLVGRLCAQLETRQEGLRGLRISARRSDHSETSAEVGLARASRDAGLILRLCRRPVEAMDAGFGIEALGIQGLAVEPLTLRRQDRLSEGGGLAEEASEWDALMSRLGGRLGFERILYFRQRETHIPERRTQLVPMTEGEPRQPGRTKDSPEGGVLALRPLVLFGPEPVRDVAPGRPPAVFEWRRRSYRTVHAVGPERIAPQWWRDDPAWTGGVRDYWRVQTGEGPRLWLFHLPQKGRAPQWFVQGEFP